jgi:osmotically inducible lipoprotein OsmB
MKMKSRNTNKRTLRAAIIALGGAVALTAMTGCYSPRATDTVTGAALGAGTGALIGSAEGSPGTGALIGGLGGGAVGYIVGTEMYHNGYYGRGGYYPGGF